MMLTEQQVRDIIAQNKKVAVKVYQDKCPWCEKFAPVFSAAADKHKDVVFASFSPEKQSAFRTEFLSGKDNVPATALFQDGKLVGTVFGYIESKQLDEFITTGKYTPKKPAKPDPREYAIKASMEQLVNSVSEIRVQVKEQELAAAIFEAELARRNVLLPKEKACTDCAKKIRPWKLEFWQTDCRLCLRIQGAMLAFGVAILVFLW